MNYKQFLLSQLLRDTIEEYKFLEYDTLFDIAKNEAIAIFEIQEDRTKDLYWEIEDFVKNNKTLLIKLITK